MTMKRPAAVLALLVLVAALGACPKRFDPTSPPDPTRAGDPAARARFDRARVMFERDEYGAAAEEFERIAREFPEDPIAAHAALYAGMAAYRKGDHAAAAEALRPLADDRRLEEGVRKRARFYLGLSYAYLGRHADAWALLGPFEGELATDAETIELHAALAESAAGLGDGETALRQYDAWWAGARPAERAHIVTRVRGIVDALPEPAVRRAWQRAGKSGPAAAFLGRRLAVILRASGDAQGAADVLAASAGARAAIGLEDATPSRAVADPQLVGAVVPLSGRGRLVGEAFLRGLALAAGTFDAAQAAAPPAEAASRGAPRPFSVAIEDGGASPEAAAQAAEALARHGVIAIVGPSDKEATDAAARRAEALAVPIVTLDVAGAPATEGAPHVFRIAPTVEARSRALAREAVRRGARSFAILAPKMAYGTRAAQAFRDEVERLGGAVLAEVTYERDATSFVEPVRAIAGKPWDALFVPDAASRLELIAPQLAVANLVVGPFGAKKPRRGRAVVLLSLAEALSPKFLAGSGRYTRGALFAPGFYPDEKDPRIGAYVARYRAAYGGEPTYLDAYAYDAALVVRAAVEAGARERDAVAAAMARATVPGLTGDIRFDASRERADAGVLFTVEATADGHEIRALR